MRIFFQSMRMSFHHCGRAQQVKRVNIAPEQVIITQKFMWGAVHGENIMVHSTAAMQMPRTGFRNDMLFVFICLDELGCYQSDSQEH